MALRAVCSFSYYKRKKVWIMRLDKITYYFRGEHTKEINKLLSEPLFKQIMNYLFEQRDQEIILRQLKAAIPTTQNLELLLDQMIAYGLIKRENRRYSLSIPIFSRTEALKIPDTIYTALDKLVKEIDSDALIFGEVLWPAFFEDEDTHYFFGVENQDEALSFVNKVTSGNDELQFISLHSDTASPLALADYFSLLKTNSSLPKTFKPLEQSIGDVDIDYFVAQVQKIIRSIRRVKTKQLKRNIFQEALVITEDLVKTEEGAYKLVSPIIQKDTLAIEEEKFTRIKMMLIQLWQEIEDKNQRVFMKKQLYNQLFHKYLAEKEMLHYFKK
ncbi:DUF1803 domain-containing protein [Enterococcus termitis]|nr:DUF1803 domain-containing protein [Enterococcus termitis]OJG98290.1 hypothetical protein RV18_GL003607 [Enterococcus termitis]